ncbi:CopD family protein [Herbaspirillum sp. LeCh32-8]|uniref:CopD family protein n=1 Tax=Herbaspirillum sp. LeCh32-8 TaxID=2821356 RepID=UPI001AE37818|nr:CopD family protein [Herbaspirillum sp. LeCh32-8]MBP0600683.1 CopD family protein [Herbaspirillum sp. LeCh32-8]
MLWIKALHIVFIASWFAGLFYLPRIYVNLAQETEVVARERLLGMAQRLYRFTGIMALLALGSGIWVLHAMYTFAIFRVPGNGWLHAKLFLVLLVIGYHHACGSLLKKFALGKNARSHVWYRWFNEVPVLLLLAIVILVVVKPF